MMPDKNIIFSKHYVNVSLVKMELILKLSNVKTHFLKIGDFELLSLHFNGDCHKNLKNSANKFHSIPSISCHFK